MCKIDKKLAESVQEFLKNKFSVSYYKNEKIALIHNDVHPRNIIVEEGEIKYIDWDCSRFAHREADFVKLRHLSRNSTDEESIKFFGKNTFSCGRVRQNVERRLLAPPYP